LSRRGKLIETKKGRKMLSARTQLSAFLFAFSLSPITLAQQESISINDFGFLQGYWQGTGFGGESEEIWMPPSGGRMFGVFKQSQDSELVFTEFMEILESDEGFLLRLKHFNPDFSGWEEKDEHLTFKLTSVSKTKAVFGGLSYEITSPNSLQIRLKMFDDNGESVTEIFDFERSELP